MSFFSPHRRSMSTSLIITLTIAVFLFACVPGAIPTAQPQAEPDQAAEAPGEMEAEAPSEEAPAEVEPIKIGINKPMTGAVGFLGQDEREGFELAKKEINAQGGVLGRPLELIYGDNQCNPTEAVNAHRQLLDLHDVVVTSGGACSSATLAMMPIAEEAGIPNLTISSTSPEITRRAGVGGNIWEFRLNVDDSIMAQHFTKFIADEAGSVMMIGANNDWGRGAVAAYEPLFGEMGVDFLGAEYFEQGQADFRPLLTKLRSQDPEALLLIMESRDAATLVRQMKEMGWDPRPRIFARGSVVTPEFAETVEDDCSLGDGIMEATLNASGIYPAFDEAFVEEYGHEPHLSSGLGYSGLYAIARAIENAGSAEPAAIRAALEELNYEDPIVGHVEFDDHHQAHPNMVVTTMQNCEIELLDVISTEEE